MSLQKSTIGRFIVRAQLTGVRSAFGVLERVAPDLGGRWAARLWLTVPRFRGRSRPRVIPPGESFTLRVGGRSVVGTTWGAGPAVYLVHGWGGASSQLHAFVAPLVEAGYRVVTYDALGHGESDPGALGGRRTTIPEMAAALLAVVKAHGPAHAVIAHSAGSSATFYALRGGLRTTRLVFLAPMAQPTPLTMVFAATLGFGERIRLRMLDEIAARAGAPWDDFDMPEMVTRIAPPPLLTVHDPGDRETRYADSVVLAKVWPSAELVTVKELGHWRVLRDPATVARAVSFVTAPNDATETATNTARAS